MLCTSLVRISPLSSLASAWWMDGAIRRRYRRLVVSSTKRTVHTLWSGTKKKAFLFGFPSTHARTDCEELINFAWCQPEYQVSAFRQTVFGESAVLEFGIPTVQQFSVEFIIESSINIQYIWFTTYRAIDKPSVSSEMIRRRERQLTTSLSSTVYILLVFHLTKTWLSSQDNKT